MTLHELIEVLEEACVHTSSDTQVCVNDDYYGVQDVSRVVISHTTSDGITRVVINLFDDRTVTRDITDEVSHV